MSNKHKNRIARYQEKKNQKEELKKISWDDIQTDSQFNTNVERDFWILYFETFFETVKWRGLQVEIRKRKINNYETWHYTDELQDSEFYYKTLKNMMDCLKVQNSISWYNIEWTNIHKIKMIVIRCNNIGVKNDRT